MKAALKPSKPIALIQTGHTTPRLLQTFGDYDVWFRQRLGLPASCKGLKLYNVFDGEVMPTAEELEKDCSGVLITGSPSYVTEKLPWSVAIGRVLNDLSKRGKIPILGVCYGHQLLCDCTGGKVGFNPHGTSQGSKVTQLKREVIEADPLFRIFSQEPVIIGHVSHSQVALELPEGAVSLAYNDVDTNHAVRYVNH